MECLTPSTCNIILYSTPTTKPTYWSSSPWLHPYNLKTPKIATLSSSYQRLSVSSSTTNRITETKSPKTEVYDVKFETLGACKLGIARYPDFEYNAKGGRGIGKGSKIVDINNSDDEISVDFDLKTLHIPPLRTATTKYLGLPLPPFLKIDIVPEVFRGSIQQDSGKVELEFIAKFLFSVGNVYRAPPLLVGTVLTSEESKGSIRIGRGERLNEAGMCKLVGVATVEPINDLLMNSFLGLPSECLANLNAIISISSSYE